MGLFDEFNIGQHADEVPSLGAEIADYIESIRAKAPEVTRYMRDNPPLSELYPKMNIFKQKLEDVCKAGSEGWIWHKRIGDNTLLHNKGLSMNFDIYATPDVASRGPGKPV